MLFAKMRSAGFGSDLGIAGSPVVRQWLSQKMVAAGNSHSAENHAEKPCKKASFPNKIPPKSHRNPWQGHGSARSTQGLRGGFGSRLHGTVELWRGLLWCS